VAASERKGSRYRKSYRRKGGKASKSSKSWHLAVYLPSAGEESGIWRRAGPLAIENKRESRIRKAHGERAKEGVAESFASSEIERRRIKAANEPAKERRNSGGGRQPKRAYRKNIRRQSKAEGSLAGRKIYQQPKYEKQSSKGLTEAKKKYRKSCKVTRWRK